MDNLVATKKQEESAWIVFICIVAAGILIVACAISMPIGASWYGMDRKGMLTASGRVFDPSEFTAASWQYPFGSMLKVTNVDNGKSVVVEVTDRGPAKRLVRQGRKIDLSRAAFARIADLNDGVIPVKISLLKTR